MRGDYIEDVKYRDMLRKTVGADKARIAMENIALRRALRIVKTWMETDYHALDILSEDVIKQVLREYKI